MSTDPLIGLAGVLFIGAALINMTNPESQLALNLAYLFIGLANLSFASL
jgi:hypothetical protein